MSGQSDHVREAMPQSIPKSPLETVRVVILAALLVSLAGMLVELFLLEHTEDPWQWVPIGLGAASVLVLGWYAIARSAGSLQVFRALMVLCIVGGVTGVLLHYRGNVEFELEMYPDLAGFKLFKDAMMGATPALAPGVMIQIGLIGLAWTIRHPALARASSTSSHQDHPS